MLLLSGCSVVEQAYFFIDAESSAKSVAEFEDGLNVVFMDVGQADAILIECENEIMLIDGGNVADSDLVCDTISSYGIETLNYIVNTHAHEDHCGGLTSAVDNFDVENAINSPVGADTKCYQNFINSLNENSVATKSAVAGETFTVGIADVEIIGPVNETNNLNNSSVVLKLKYMDKAVVFTGDMELEEERSIIDAGFDVTCDVLKAGHHGSETSSGYVFLRESMPSYAVISVGRNNRYGHPGENTLSRFRDLECETYRTDVSGTILLNIDKNGNISFNCD